MKNLSLCIFILATSHSFAQTIPLDSFFATGTTWTQAVYSDDKSINYHWHNWGTEKIVYKIVGDTTVASIKYHEVAVADEGGYAFETSVYNPGSTWFAYNVPHSFRFQKFGRIRVDSNKVYFTQDVIISWASGFTIGVEYELYNFNLAVGTMTTDSITGPINVVNIDSVLLSNGDYIHRYNDYSGLYWLYGIGSNIGLFPYDIIWEGPGIYIVDQKLLCYDNPHFSYHLPYTDSILVGLLQYNCFDLSTVNVKNVTKPADELKLYPDPLIDDYLHINEANAGQINSVNIFDVTGKVFLSFGHIFHNGDNQLYVPLQPGTYIVQIEYGDLSIETRKLIRL